MLATQATSGVAILTRRLPHPKAVAAPNVTRTFASTGTKGTKMLPTRHHKTPNHARRWMPPPDGSLPLLATTGWIACDVNPSGTTGRLPVMPSPNGLTLPLLPVA